MSSPSEHINIEADRQVKDILEVVMCYARLDFSKKTAIPGNDEVLDAIGTGVNMLGEELETSIISLKEKEKLLKEIHHRVKNNMQIVSSLLKLQSEKVLDKKYLDLINESQNRIASMALVHEMLYSSKDLSKIEMKEYIARLCYSIYQSFFKPGLNVSFAYDIDTQLFFDIDRLVPLGLILNEIVSNSFKHAFPAGKGIISISLRGSGIAFQLTVADNGTGFTKDFKAQKDGHLGMQLIYMLSEQIDAKIEIKQEPGVAYTITFP